MTNKISIKNLNFSYDKKSLVIKDFSFDFYCGNIYLLSGLNASGKSTLCNLIADLIYLNQGEIDYFNEIKVTNKKEAKKYFNQINQRIGYVFQFCEKQLFCENIYDDVMFGLKNANYDVIKANELAKQ